MDPLSLQNLLAHFQTEFDEINKTWMVINESHVGNILAEVSVEDNMFLIGLLPSYNTNGENSDNFRTVTYGQFLIVEKADYSDLNQQQFLDVFQRTFLVAEKLRDFLVDYSAEKQCEYPFLMQLDINSLSIEPIYKLSDCNGWTLEFEI